MLSLFQTSFPFFQFLLVLVEEKHKYLSVQVLIYTHLFNCIRCQTTNLLPPTKNVKVALLWLKMCLNVIVY